MRNVRDISDPVIVVDGKARRTSTLTEREASAAWDAIEWATGEAGERAETADAAVWEESRPQTSRAYVTAFALAHDVLFDLRFSYRRAS